MTDVAADPRRPGVATVEADGHQLRLYHIAHSSQHMAEPNDRSAPVTPSARVEMADDGVVDILGLIRERMLRGRALQHMLRDGES